jgi:hypothetical protein
MGKPTGFLEIERQDRGYQKPEERLKTWNEFVKPLPADQVSQQAARCMDCGIPFCHQGCPVNNQIPDWNNLVYRSQWRIALDNLHTTNNFPEFTGRICPAPCDRVRDCRSWMEGGLDHAAAGGEQDRKDGGRGRLRSRGPGLQPATGPRWP